MFRLQHLSRSAAGRSRPTRLSTHCCTCSFRAASARQGLSRPFATTLPRAIHQPSPVHNSTNENAVGSQVELGDTKRPARPKVRLRHGRFIVVATAFLLLGGSIGSIFRSFAAPPPLPEPGTDQDRLLVNWIHEKAADLPIVKKLSGDPSWESWQAYEDFSGREPSISSSAMSGSRGLAYQRIFHNKETDEIISVVYFGGALSGFPGVTHGGALATLLDESLGRCAILRFPARTAVTANLDVTYKKPTPTNSFYVLRTKPIILESDEVVGPDGTKKSDRKLWVQGSIESLEGQVKVEAKALFIVPRGVKTRSMNMRW